MYQMNDLELWHQRRDELLREVEVDRLARRHRATRPKGGSRTANGRQIATLRRAMALWGRTSVPFFRA
jgi:hypothetical protein